MRRILFFITLVLGLSPAIVLASFETSKSWFERLTADERTAVQADLVLLGHYGFLVDGEFGRATFDAIADFQKSQGSTGSGVLDPAEMTNLAELADRTQQRLGMRRVTDQPARVSMTIPSNLLTRRTPTEQGTSYVSADGEISLETMHTALADQSFRDLYEMLTAPDPERSVTYRNFTENRFVVSGDIGEYAFYTMFVAEDGEAMGYSLAWGKGYASEGAISSVWIASHFSPLGNLPSLPDTKLAAVPAEASGSFELPEDELDVIALNAEIVPGTPGELDKALEARPNARTLVLNSPGGAVDGALVIAQEVRRRGMRTYIPEDMGCYSACAYIFFAGENRIADGELGVHQISQDVADIILTQITIGDILDALDEFGVQHQVISFMLRTPPDDMHVFSRLELAELGINRGEPIKVALTAEKPVADPGEATGATAAFVQLASRVDRDEATRSLTYAEDRWGRLFGEARPEIEASADDVFRVRLPLRSVERANAICAAIKAEGGGCYVTTAGS